MSSDFKFDIFAYYCFHMDWTHLNKEQIEYTILKNYGDECEKDKSYKEEVCDVNLSIAVKCRYLHFSTLYRQELHYDEAIKWRCLGDFYDHVARVCDRDDWFGYMHIFDKMFATCAFVLYMCLHIQQDCIIDVINYGYVIWAMYFDKYIEEFYQQGGWNTLKKEAERCVWQYKFIEIFSFDAAYLRRLKEASTNYCKFKMYVKDHACQYKQKCRIKVGRLWIKFRIEHFEQHVKIPPNYEDLIDSLDIAELFEQLNVIHNSFDFDIELFEKKQKKHEMRFRSERKLLSVLLNCSEETGSREGLDEDLLKVLDTFFDEHSEITENSEESLDRECSSPSKIIANHEVIDETEYVRNNLSEIRTVEKRDENLDRYSPNSFYILHDNTLRSQFDANIENSNEIANFDLNKDISLPYIKCENDLDDPSSRNKKPLCEPSISGNVSSSKLKEENDWYINYYFKNLPEVIDPYSEDELANRYNEEESSSKSNFDSKTEEKYHAGNLELTRALSITQMDTTQCEINANSNEVSISKDFIALNEVVKNSAEGININKKLGQLREEQRDPEIRKILQLLLVLDNGPWIQYVRQTEKRNEAHEHSPVKSNKRMKRSLNTSRK